MEQGQLPGLQLRKQKDSGGRRFSTCGASAWTQIPVDGTSHSPGSEKQGAEEKARAPCILGREYFTLKGNVSAP